VWYIDGINGQKEEWTQSLTFLTATACPLLVADPFPPSGRRRNRCTFARFAAEDTDSFEQKEGVAGAGECRSVFVAQSHSERANVRPLSREMILSRSVASVFKQCRHGYFSFDESARIAD
jgi:hypothetical protein